MEKRTYKTDAERDAIINEYGGDKTIVHHINLDGSKELHIHPLAPLSCDEKIAALEVRVAALEKV